MDHAFSIMVGSESRPQFMHSHKMRYDRDAFPGLCKSALHFSKASPGTTKWRESVRFFENDARGLAGGGLTCLIELLITVSLFEVFDGRLTKRAVGNKHLFTRSFAAAYSLKGVAAATSLFLVCWKYWRHARASHASR